MPYRRRALSQVAPVAAALTIGVQAAVGVAPAGGPAAEGRPRPPYPGDVVQQPFPWQVLGSPYLPVFPLREVTYMGTPPSPDGPCYGRLQRSYVTPLVFRLNYLEA